MREFTFPVCGQEWPVHVPDRSEDLHEFRAWILRHRTQTIAVDTEGKGLQILSGDPGYIRLVQFGTATEAWNIPVELGQAFREAARWALEALTSVVGHNWLGFDALALSASLGLDYDVLCRKATDTLYLSKLIDPRSQHEGGVGHSLKPLADHYIDPSAADTQGDLTAVFRSLGLTKATGFAGVDLFHPVYQSYAGGDVILTSRLLPALLEEHKRVGVRQALVPFEHEIGRICGHMQLTGMVHDRAYTHTLADRLDSEASEYSLVAARYGVEKIGAPKQIAAALIGLGETLTERTASGAYKVDKAVLEEIAASSRPAQPLAEAIIKAKRAAKWKSAYAENFLATEDVNGRIHPNIQTMAARTYRMSVTNPAVQTLPSGDWMIRRSLMADEGHRIISCDFDGVELRVLAAVGGVTKMKNAIIAGEDLHSTTARLIFGPGFTKAQRKIAKTINFGVVYGGGASTISRQAGIPLSEAQSAVAAYHRAYPEIKRFGNRLQREAFANGMTIRSITGRILKLDRDRTYAATNYDVQSPARDCLGQSLIEMDRRGLTPFLRLAVHDEVIASAPESQVHEVAQEIKECMNFDLMGVPITASPDIAGRSWGSLYMKDKRTDRYLPDVLIQHDPYFAAHPEEAHALAA